MEIKIICRRGFRFADDANFADFTLLFCIGWLRNVHSFKTHVLSNWARCRRRRSLLKLPIIPYNVFKFSAIPLETYPWSSNPWHFLGILIHEKIVRFLSRRALETPVL